MADIFFNSQSNQPIKFFIQKSLPPEEIAQLERNITENGGRVLSKVPVQGYILIDPESLEAVRLKNCWMGPGNPQRYFIPYTFVRECLAAGGLLPQVFRKEDGSSRQFYIHGSVDNEDILRKLSDQIQHSGGELVKMKDDAEIIIADERWSGFEALSIYYDDAKTKAVEGVPWIRQTIATGTLCFSMIKRKNLGGRLIGSKRTEFTKKDDNDLAQYIARKLPNPDMKGRTGNNLYKELCNTPKLYPWAARHPWQSWRERYRNNVQRYNNLIATFVEFDSISKQQLHNSPKPEQEENGIPPAKDALKETTTPKKDIEDTSESHWSIKVGTREPPLWGNPRKRQRSVREQETHGKRAKLIEEDTTAKDLNAEVPNSLRCSLSIQEQTPFMNNELQKENLSDDQETTVSSDTEDEQLIVGASTQAFLKASRQLVEDILIFEEEYKPALTKIARRYHFLQDEVEETFRGFGQDLGATEQHFREIREYITQKRAHGIHQGPG